MRAAVVTGPRTLRLDEVALPAPGPDQVVIGVAACGVCGSNLHEWREPSQAISGAGSTALGANGHEVSGRITAVGTDVEMSVGTRVVVEPNLARACGACPACRAGTAWFCRAGGGVATWGFADSMVVPGVAVFPVPATVDDDAATLVEPLACVVHGLRGSATCLSSGGDLGGATVAIVGAGVAGLLAIPAARYLGAGQVVVVARHAHQAAAARDLGADVVLDSRAPDHADALRAARPDLVLEAVGGSADTFDLAVRAVAPGGEVVVLGLFDEPQVIAARRATFRELRVWFPVTYSVRDGVHDFDVALAILAATPAAAGLVSHRFPLADLGDAFLRADDKSEGVLRVVVQP